MFDTGRATVSSDRGRAVGWAVLVTLAVAVLSILVWQGVTADGAPDPTVPGLHHRAIVLDAGVLVFREGLEAILVLAAITLELRRRAGRISAAGRGRIRRGHPRDGRHLVHRYRHHRRHQCAGARCAGGDRIARVSGPAGRDELVLPRIYWTGWIAHHNRRRRELLSSGGAGALLGLGSLGFTAIYREGFEVVLFLQSLRLQAGAGVVLQGVAIGLGFTAAVAILTFVPSEAAIQANARFDRRLLGFVLVVMVGESVQEMQLAGWVPTTTVNVPAPDWMGVWFAFFPTVETIVGQALAALLVIGSYVVARETRLIRMPGRSTT